jgi:hypothetical protein
MTYTVAAVALLFSGASVAGFFGALLGIGGGLFIVPLLVLIFHLPMKTAVAASLVSVIATSNDRFALTSFLANIGLDKEQIMDLYRMAPDFREDLTRYQVEHITGGSGTEYTAPSCKTMMTYGNCSGKNPQCEWVTHPLSYYRKALARRAKMRIAPPVPKPDVPAKDAAGNVESR